MSLVESVNGRPTLVQLPNGGIRRYIYDNENRLSRYQTETGAEFSVIQRNGNQLIWTDGDRFQFVSPNEITPATALERGMPFRFSRIAYPGGGLFREFRYDGDTLVYLNEGGTIYERIREGNTYIDLWRRNGSSTDLWLGPMNVASDGTFTEYRHSYLSNRSITPDGTNQWTPATQTLNLGSGQLLTVQSDGRHSLTVNGRQPLHPITLPGRLHYQQWETGGSVLRNDSGLCYPIVFTYPEGSEVLYRRFDCRDGVVQSMTFRRRGDSAPTVVTREGRHTYRVVGPGVNRLYRDCQISAGANGEFSWTLGEDFRVESQDIRTGAITLRSTF